MYCDSVFENIENVQIEDLTWDQLTWEYPMPMFLFCGATTLGDLFPTFGVTYSVNSPL